VRETERGRERERERVRDRESERQREGEAGERSEVYTFVGIQEALT